MLSSQVFIKKLDWVNLFKGICCVSSGVSKNYGLSTRMGA
jgi:hypothetical protein